ncbi:hypothetical protein [Spirillospora sp. NPDC047279]|uniref:hypothetical protein n=1 Tax=Spirillospora sp. NPDC047279 TaxID=3155478 RepID=UPI0033DDE471
MTDQPSTSTSTHPPQAEIAAELARTAQELIADAQRLIQERARHAARVHYAMATNLERLADLADPAAADLIADYRQRSQRHRTTADQIRARHHHAR